MDEIIIEGLQVYAYHGVYKEENDAGQNFYVNAVLYTDTAGAGKADKLELTTNYGEVCHFIHDLIAGTVFKLIETVAEKTAEAVLKEFPYLDGITLEIRKPEAPVGLEFDSVSVKITRMWHTAVLATGSNVGDKKKYITEALKAIDADEKCRILKSSSLMQTTAYGDVRQDDFVNGALVMKTLYTPEELLVRIHEIEAAAGRERNIHWGPRTLDIDIIFYDDLILHTDTLQIPHADMANRDFVLAPLSQIVPYMRDPLSGKTIVQLYEEVQKAGEKHVVDTEYIH
ncbi:MAG: 2-amino-4-hydroxy-6-hydroxymethyldihydropteridine diphosphokinase [Roseburia sp.]|nr:2-amino-4-hydroxy-6-hydroxymethyldihydropteridine diphosphokinase [Ruminococcus sp.]MCM1155569.1 2-amino-4-hydroxy-6-hydroxymethyldihydropteridine diphosphokinase [Roseburia sp.]MCM1242406.1 2-amino-4-hydroxy-6-hydroxymethyldihydropteridine diphosphokinase [Roseburia sp.]